MNTGHWEVNQGIIFDENVYGFIYEITNKTTGKTYIGKKQCKTKLKRKPLKGKKNKRIEVKETDWRNYTSSSVELNNDIAKLGKDKFIFKIIKICGSKWELAYFEIKEQIHREVLLNDNFYNGIINVRIGRPPKNMLKK